MSREITINSAPVKLLGEEIKVGQSAPSFTVVDKDLKPVESETFKDKIKLIASVPSLDTPICDLQIKRFNDEASKMSKDIVIVFVSMDLPFAQKRFCQAYDIKKVKTFSDHAQADFGMKYGVLIDGIRLLSRAIFIVDKDNTVAYTEYVPELASHPDYDKALTVLSGLV